MPFGSLYLIRIFLRLRIRIQEAKMLLIHESSFSIVRHHSKFFLIIYSCLIVQTRTYSSVFSKISSTTYASGLLKASVQLPRDRPENSSALAALLSLRGLNLYQFRHSKRTLCSPTSRRPSWTRWQRTGGWWRARHMLEVTWRP